MSLLLYSEREQRDLFFLEKRANVKFSRVGPPSVATVMDAAAGVVSRRLNTVDSNVLPYFAESAKEILEADNAVDQVYPVALVLTSCLC